MLTMITGTLRAAVISRRRRSPSGSPASAAAPARGRGGSGTRAVYPVRSTVAIRSATPTPGPTATLAFSVAKLTVAATPSIRFSFFSIRAAQEAQVIPLMDSSISARPAVVTLISPPVRWLVP